MNIEYDLKEILSEFKQEFVKIEARFDKLEGKIDKVGADVSELKTDLARVEAELKGEIRVFDEKIGGINNSLGEKIDGIAKRVDTQEFVNRGVIIGLILAILDGFAKVFGLVGSP